jgi:5-methylcytosine-specific restriction endonuclease McrA
MTREGKHPAANGGKWIRPERRLGIHLRHQFRCVYCLTSLYDAAPRDITLDHIIPSSCMGTNASDNLVTSCRKCNCARGNKAIQLFATDEALARIAEETKLPVNIALAKSLISQRKGH